MQTFNIIDALSKFDLEFLKEKKIDTEKIITQYNNCLTGNSPLNLLRVATANDGIQSHANSEKKELVAFYDTESANFSIEKFVPASGAATRMFKFLIDFITHFDPENETINTYINKHKSHELTAFIIGLEKFSFYDVVYKECLNLYPNYKTLSQELQLYYFVKIMLENPTFAFSKKPKALIPFHKINHELSTPINCHIEEAIKTIGKNGKIHFTVCGGLEQQFINEIQKTKTNYHVSFSNQLSETDSVAFDLDNNFFRLQDNKLLFRPGGHGALIENLNALKSDIIFIKNIDNVSVKHIDEIVFNKKYLGGILLKNQQTIFQILNNFENIKTQENIVEILNYMEKKLNIYIPNHIKINSTLNEIKTFIKEKLNRPIRVCGMVKNEGDPGGGPFWVKNSDGEISLQIVETAQIDLKDVKQQLILSQATHFNPVDLVCGIKNHKGEKFDLTEYVDKNTGFVVQKTHEGRDLKSYELPGLWNGAMSDWISIFVEVPVITFNPVKTVIDLLKPAHQANHNI